MNKICDKCGNVIRDTKYPWYSYYSPKGETTSILFRYCTESKIIIQTLYGISDGNFDKAENDTEDHEYSLMYIETRTMEE